MNKEQFVNGPVNTVRLEGEVDGVKKTVYIFMDIHIPPQYQSECDDIRSYDVNRFVVKEFDKLLDIDKNKTYDFFIERDPLYPHFVDPKTKGRYLDQTLTLFKRAFKIDLKTGKVDRSTELPNVRLHYADVRGYMINKLDTVYKGIVDILNMFWDRMGYNYNDILRIIEGLTLIDSQMVYLYKLIYENKDLQKPPKTKVMFSQSQVVLSNYSKDDYEAISKKIIYKLLKGYKNDKVKNTINKIINSDFHDKFKNFFADMDKITKGLLEIAKLLEPFKDKYISDQLIERPDGKFFYGIDGDIIRDNILYLYNIKNKLFTHLFGGIGLYFMDLYLLRRLLDKDYITNTIVYTGAHHSNNYIRLLVKYFDFKITHYSYLKDDDIKKAEDIIKKSKDEEELNVLFYPPAFQQCSDLSDFPELFE